MIHLPHLQPKAFWPYASGVMHASRIMEVRYSSGDTFDRWRDDLIVLFREHGIKCAVDNKIVFEFWDTIQEKPIFVGFYDLQMSIGYQMRSDHIRGYYPSRKHQFRYGPGARCGASYERQVSGMDSTHYCQLPHGHGGEHGEGGDDKDMHEYRATGTPRED